MIDLVLCFPRIAIERMISSVSCLPEIKGRWALISIHESKDPLDFRQTDILSKLGCEAVKSFRFADIAGKENIPAIMAVLHVNNINEVLFNKNHAIEINSLSTGTRPVVYVR